MRHSPRIGLLLAGLLLAISASPSGASETSDAAPLAGDDSRGEALARHWCAGCHLVGGPNSGTDAAPPFRTIARNPSKDAAFLRSFLTHPHPPMAALSLSRAEIEDLVAYFHRLSLPG
ncbi:MAG TPA: cytochrome c [Aliidongia sp.]|nr:cytochrome c [Aliidongia sp.]